MTKTHCNLPLNVTKSVKSFLSEKFIPPLKAAYLTGSWALKTATSSSDIDLLAIVDRNEYANKTRADMQKWLQRVRVSRDSSRSSRLDLKCLSLTELRSAYHSDQHFAVWTRLSNAILLMGTEVRNEFPLSIHLLKSALGRWLDHISEVSVLASKEVYFEYISTSLVSFLKSIYFILTHVLVQNTGSPPRKWVSDTLGRISKPVIKAYDRFVSASVEILGPQVPLEVDCSHSDRYSAKMYRVLVETSDEVHQLGNEIYRKISLLDEY